MTSSASLEGQRPQRQPKSGFPISDHFSVQASFIVLATRFAPELLFKPVKLSLSAPIFVR